MSEQIETLSLGQQLKAKRGLLSLSILEVSRQTHLKENHIEAFENDIFILKNIPPVFVRGYLKKYATFLKLPESVLAEIPDNDTATPPITRKSREIKPTSPLQKINWVKVLTWLILLIVMGMTFVWWWQEHQKEISNREAYIEQYQATPKGEQDPPSANLMVSSLPEKRTPLETKMETANISTSPEVVEYVEPISVSSQSEPEPTPELQTPAISDELYIEIHTGESWISVKNKEKRLAEKLYHQGEIIRLNDHEFYSLIIGAPANVKLYYKGQEVPLKVDGRVARIKLPQ